MIVRDALNKYEQDALTRGLEKRAVALLIAHLLKIEVGEIVFYLDKKISEKCFLELYDKYCQQVPVQYLTNKAYFYNREFYVDSRVLIPRRETEELVEQTLQEIDDFFTVETLQCLDIGVGSGIIPVTMHLENPLLNFYAVDISKDALEVAEKNSQSYDVNIEFHHGDTFEPLKTEKFDVIISNPPYIDYTERISKLVYDNEPHIALFAENQGLAIYQKILSECHKFQKGKMLIALEIGSQQAEAIKKLAKKYLENYDLTIKKDLQGLDRIVIIKLSR